MTRTLDLSPPAPTVRTVDLVANRYHVHERDHDPLRRSALGGLGLLLPSISRIKPGLTVLAALGCAVLMGAAILFHLSRGEAASTPFNVLLAALALFVAWGRRSKAPIAPRA